MPIQNFPTRNAKLEFPAWKKMVIAEATRRGLKGYVLNTTEYENSAGQVKGDVFTPLKRPKLPGEDAKSIAWTRYSILNTAYEEKQEKPLIEFTLSFVTALSPTEIAIIGGGVEGTQNKTLMEMLNALSEHYEKWSPTELKHLKDTLFNGTIAINTDEPIDIYLNKVNNIHNVAEANMSAIPEHEKIDGISKELRKLNIAQLNLWIMTYENSTPEIADKDYDKFTKQLKTLFRTLDKDTMKSAGYDASSAQATRPNTETQNEVMAQLARLEKMLDANIKPNNEGENRESAGLKPFFYCHSCQFQKSHWSAMCRKPKKGHDKSKNHPNA
jgi:hypothetical protein